MTPFLGTATAQQAPASAVREHEVEAELDVPIDVEEPVVAIVPPPVVAASPPSDDEPPRVMDEPPAMLDEPPAFVAAPLDELVEDDGIEAPGNELTEPLYLESDDSQDVGLAFHELTTVTANVASSSEPVIELAESPAPAAEVADAPRLAVALPDVVEEPPAPPRGEFDDVELAVLLPSAEPPPVMMRRPATDPAALLPRRPLPPKRSSNVDDLLNSFGHEARDAGDEEDVRSTLKRLAGLEPTPLPPDATRS